MTKVENNGEGATLFSAAKSFAWAALITSQVFDGIFVVLELTSVHARMLASSRQLDQQALLTWLTTSCCLWFAYQGREAANFASTGGVTGVLRPPGKVCWMVVVISTGNRSPCEPEP